VDGGYLLESFQRRGYASTPGKLSPRPFGGEGPGVRGVKNQVLTAHREEAEDKAGMSLINKRIEECDNYYKSGGFTWLLAKSRGSRIRRIPRNSELETCGFLHITQLAGKIIKPVISCLA